jgi:hypothetical protein
MWSPHVRHSLLTRHFLRQFVENDLVSAEADRHEVLAMVAAALIAIPICATVLLSVKYLFRPFQSQGWTAVTVLDDQFLYVACSMIVMAVVAVIEWDALALDWRDTAVLGPLPISRKTIFGAKLAAIGLFAGGFAVALNGAPSILHPVLVAAKLPVSFAVAATLVASHAISSLAAGLFGFVLVLGIRECLRAILAAAWFDRVAVFVRAGLIVLLVAALLLVPALSSKVAYTWLGSSRTSPYVVPPLWFVGLHETISGYVLDRSARPALPPRIRAEEEAATLVYRTHRDLFRVLAAEAIGALTIVLLVSLVAYAWNARTLPAPPSSNSARHHRWRAGLVGRVRGLIAPRPATLAGFSFAAQTFWRSPPHRLSLATSIAVGLAVATGCLRAAGLDRIPEPTFAPLSLLAMQVMMVALLVAGIRRAVRMPADPRAGWIFTIAGSGDERPYAKGVVRAATSMLLIPALAVLFPLHAFLLGWQVATTHGVFGLLGGLVLLQWTTFDGRKFPLADTYAPAENLHMMGPPYAVLFLATAFLCAWIERLALGSVLGSAALTPR